MVVATTTWIGLPSGMKLAVVIAVLVVAGAAAAFMLLDATSATMVVLAGFAAVFFGSLPWIIGGVMDRKGEERSGGVVVKGFEERED
jgi:hypothetical protein